MWPHMRAMLHAACCMLQIRSYSSLLKALPHFEFMLQSCCIMLHIGSGDMRKLAGALNSGVFTLIHDVKDQVP